MKTVGVIGGLGPETTAEFYMELVFGCYDKNKEQRPPILIWNVPLKYKVEEDLLSGEGGEDRYVPYLVEAAKRLEKDGADFLVMPCNTLHMFIDKIREAVKIPVLSIIEETAAFLKGAGINEVGILATSATIESRLYHDLLEKQGIKLVVPEGLDQARIGRIIKNLVLSRVANKDRDELIETMDHFSNQGLKTVILACTDLQLLIPEHPSLEIHDTMKLFALATVDRILE